MPLKKKSVILVRLCVLCTIKKATILTTIPSYEISINLDNLYVSN